MALGALAKWASAGDVKGILQSKFGGARQPTGSTDPHLKNRNYAVIIRQKQQLNGGVDRLVTGSVPASFQIEQSVDWKAPWGGGLVDGAMGNILAMSGNRLVAQVLTMQVWQGSGNDFEFTLQFELRAWSDPVRDVLDPLRTLLKMSMPGLKESGFLESPGPILDEEAVKAISGQFTKAGVSIAKATASGYQQGSESAAQGGSTIDGVGSFVSKVGGGLSGAAQAGYKEVGNSGIAKKKFIEDKLKHKISINIGQWFSLDNVVITRVSHDLKAQTPERNTGVIQAASVTIGFKPMFTLTSADVETMLKAGGQING
jgi:hypothetical protein